MQALPRTSRAEDWATDYLVDGPGVLRVRTGRLNADVPSLPPLRVQATVPRTRHGSPRTREAAGPQYVRRVRRIAIGRTYGCSPEAARRVNAHRQTSQ